MFTLIVTNFAFPFLSDILISIQKINLHVGLFAKLSKFDRMLETADWIRLEDVQT